MARRPDHDDSPMSPYRRRPPPVTTVSRAVVIGALAALLVGVGSSLATARLTDRQPDIDEQRAEIAELTSRVSEQEAEIGRLTGEPVGSGDPGGAGGDVDRLNVEISDLRDQLAAVEDQKDSFEEQVSVLQAENANLDEQLLQFLNPDSGPLPTAVLTVRSVRHWLPGEGPFIACVEIENTSTADVDLFYSYSQFSAADGDNFLYSPAPHMPGFQLNHPLMDGQLSPREKARGELLFNVPQGVALDRVDWNIGFGDPPEISFELPAPEFDPFGTQC